MKRQIQSLLLIPWPHLAQTLVSMRPDLLTLFLPSQYKELQSWPGRHGS